MLAFDNISTIRASLSDGLCRIATGSGFTTRSLFTNDDERLFQATRPIILNGIDFVMRSDLLDRCVSIQIPAVCDEDRKCEESLWSEFERIKSHILGALFDAVSTAISNQHKVKMRALPRMADFAKWVSGAERALTWPSGTFMAALSGNRDLVAHQALLDSPIALAVLNMVSQLRLWKGGASELLVDLNGERWSDSHMRSSKTWPKTPAVMGKRMTELAPDLRRLGVSVKNERSGKRRWWELRMTVDDPGK